MRRMDADRDAAPVIHHGDAAVGMDGDLDPVADARQGFVDGVIDHFVDEVMQGLDVRAAHIHAGAAPYGLQAFEYLDIFCFITSVIFFLSYSHNFLQISLQSRSHLDTNSGMVMESQF